MKEHIQKTGPWLVWEPTFTLQSLKDPNQTRATSAFSHQEKKIETIPPCRALVAARSSPYWFKKNLNTGDSMYKTTFSSQKEKSL